MLGFFFRVLEGGGGLSVLWPHDQQYHAQISAQDCLLYCSGMWLKALKDTRVICMQPANFAESDEAAVTSSSTCEPIVEWERQRCPARRGKWVIMQKQLTNLRNEHADPQVEALAIRCWLDLALDGSVDKMGRIPRTFTTGQACLEGTKATCTDAHFRNHYSAWPYTIVQWRTPNCHASKAGGNDSGTLHHVIASLYWLRFDASDSVTARNWEQWMPCYVTAYAKLLVKSED